jgi:surface polysaccharide O-acyltransferase-like enzyme
LPFFWLGTQIRKKDLHFIYKIPVLTYFAVDIGLFLAWRVFLESSGLLYFLLFVSGILVNFWGAVASFVVLQRLAGSIRTHKAFKRLGERSMGIYLIHQQLVYFMISLLNGKMMPIVMVGITFSLVLLLSYAIIGYLRKNGILRTLMGG